MEIWIQKRNFRESIIWRVGTWESDKNDNFEPQVPVLCQSTTKYIFYSPGNGLSLFESLRQGFLSKLTFRNIHQKVLFCTKTSNISWIASCQPGIKRSTTGVTRTRTATRITSGTDASWADQTESRSWKINISNWSWHIWSKYSPAKIIWNIKEWFVTYC